MAESKPTMLPRVRTFASDLENERKKRGLAAPVDDAASKPSAPADPTKVPVPTPRKVPTPVAIPPVRTAEAGPKPISHIVAAAPRPTSVSAAVLATRADEMKKESDARPTSVPSFHELMKRSGKPHASPSVTPERGGVMGITITNDESGATIITDTKADRFKVAPSIFISIKKWWAKNQADRKARRAPKYVVPETDRRKGIIQQATSHSGKAITDDRAQLRDQVLRRNTQKEHEPDTTKTGSTEAGSRPSAPPDDGGVVNVQVTPKQRGEERPRPVLPPVEVPAVVRAPLPPPPPLSIPVAVPPPVVAAAPLRPTQEATPITEKKVTATSAPVIAMRQEAVGPETQLRPSAPTGRLTTNLLSGSVVALIVFIAVGGVGVYRFLNTPPPPPPPVYEGVLLSAPTLKISLPILDRAAFMQSLAIASDTRSVPVIELFFINDTVVVPSADLLSLFSPTINQNLAQNVRSVVFGWYNKDIPFMVLDIADRSSVWGGLLKEEARLQSTLAPFFTFPTPLDGGFIDRKISIYDIRLLVDKTGNEHLAYSFINDNTVIITKNHETLLLLATLAGAGK
ncbi:hypothetical protein K2Q16_00945 [Patescibacteria group bacterium]|nr:hypothetical protein [Patescibacteria group bacterium]